MKKLMLISTLIFLFSHTSFSWDYIPGNGLDVSNFCENADGTRRIIALSGGGYWLSNDSGENWTPINDRVLPPNASTFHPISVYELDMVDAAGDTIITRYYCGQNLLWVYSISEDGGENWRIMMPPSFMTSAYEQFALIDPRNHSKIDYYVFDKIYTSYDFGNTWSDSIFTDHTIYSEQDFIRHNSSPDTLFICGEAYTDTTPNGAISSSYDGGHTWNPCINSNELFNFPGLRVEDIAALSNDDILAVPSRAFFGHGEESELIFGLLRSTDDGQTWQFEEFDDELSASSICEIPGYPGHLILNGYSYNSVVLSTDYGHTFAPIELDSLVAVRSVSVNTFSNAVYLNSALDGVYKSIDGGFTWEHYQTIESIGKRHSFHVNQSSISTHGLNYRSYKYNLDANQWENLFTGNYAIAPNTYVSNAVPVITDNGLTVVLSTVRSINADSRYILQKRDLESETWDEHPLPIDNYLAYLSDYTKAYYFDNDFSRLILCEYSFNNNIDTYTYHVSLDTGSTWITHEGLNWAYRPDNIIQWRDEIFLAGNQTLYKSSDNCSTWVNTNIPLGSNYRFNGVIVDDPEDESIYSFFNARCCRYYENVWQQRGTIQYVRYAALVPTDSEPVLIINRYYDELFISPDGGYTWERIDENMPFRRQISSFGQVEYDQYRNKIWVSTSIGLMYANVEELLSVDDPGSAFVPLEVRPIYAYPNPFNASINITYQVEQAGPVELKLYNITGQEVATLVSNVKKIGIHELNYNASSLASGTYFLKLNNGINSYSSKISLTK